MIRWVGVWSGGGCVVRGGVCSEVGGCLVRGMCVSCQRGRRHTHTEMATAVVGMHPTGMLSCVSIILYLKMQCTREVRM